MIEQQIETIAKETGYKLTRFKGLQQRRSFMSKAHNYTDRYASYMKDTDTKREVLLACYKKPTSKALDHIKQSVSSFRKDTTIYVQYPTGHVVLETEGGIN